MTPHGKLLTPKQIRSRARRRAARGDILTEQEQEHLYNKPIDEWDLDELAHGRPKNSRGHFRGPSPKYISAAVHEQAMTRYTAAIKTSMRASTVDAMEVLSQLINDEREDDKGKPIVSANVKLDAAKFLIEHVVGKPTQRIENDVSVKLQGILGQVMVNPNDMSNPLDQYNIGHFPGITMELAEAGDADLDRRSE